MSRWDEICLKRRLRELGALPAPTPEEEVRELRAEVLVLTNESMRLALGWATEREAVVTYHDVVGDVA